MCTPPPLNPSAVITTWTIHLNLKFVMVFRTTIKTFDERVTTPMSFILRSVPEEWLTDADKNDDYTDDGLETDCHHLRFGGREF